MDRDYTTKMEEDYIDVIGLLNTENDGLTFSQQSSELYIPTLNVCQQTCGSIFEENHNYYNSCLYQLETVFGQVRLFDEQSAKNETVQEDFNSLKEKIQQVRDLLQIPNFGSSIADINYYLGRYGRENALLGTIFGDSFSYAQSVEDMGYVTEANNSRAYIEYELEKIVTTDEEGNIIYDMDMIIHILEKDSSTITMSEYTAIAMAYLLMNEDDMEILFSNMMSVSDTCNYTCLQENMGLSVGNILENYYEWSIDDDKWNGFMQGLKLCSVCNQEMINEHQKQGIIISKVERNLCDKIVQREAIAEALLSVHEFRNIYGEKKPYLEIEKNNENNGYIIHFKEDYVINTLAGTTINSLHTSEVSIGEVYSGISAVPVTTEQIILSLHNHFAKNFTSTGFFDEQAKQDFVVEHMISFLSDISLEGTENTLNDICGGDIPIVGNLTSNVLEMFQEYNQGIKDATVIEVAASQLNELYVYSYFDCNVTIIKYETNNNQLEYMYADAGIKTQQILNRYNEYFNQEITIAQIILEPNSINEELMFQIQNGNEDIIDIIHLGK